jgi:hypothetical protein
MQFRQVLVTAAAVVMAVVALGVDPRLVHAGGA